MGLMDDMQLAYHMPPEMGEKRIVASSVSPLTPRNSIFQKPAEQEPTVIHPVGQTIIV